MPRPRSYEMQLVAYAMSRCGVVDERTGRTRPPPWLGEQLWARAYDQFLSAVGDGREPLEFRNTLKNARDAFDAHHENGRVGWIDHGDGGKPFRADAMVRSILASWGDRPEDELRAVVIAIRDGVINAVAAEDDHPETGAPPEGERRTEGDRKVYVSWRYERAPANRAAAVRLHGCICMGCRFDFAMVYGPTGAGYIEVHHAMPLAEYGRRETDPAKDLVVLCANCHRMVHRRRGICLSLSELRGLIDQTRSGAGLPTIWSE